MLHSKHTDKILSTTMNERERERERERGRERERERPEADDSIG